MSKREICGECRYEQVDIGNDHGLCQECYAVLKGTWRKLDKLDLYGYVE